MEKGIDVIDTYDNFLYSGLERIRQGAILWMDLGNIGLDALYYNASLYTIWYVLSQKREGNS
jgi:hypothetical protein